MASFTLPRYFVGRANICESDKSFAEPPLLHIIDSFFVGNRHLEEREWVVAVDAAGALQALPRENRHSLSETLQNELAYNEISRGNSVSGDRPTRLIEAIKIYLFDLQVVEQVSAAAPGLNDPVYLYGTLYELENRSAGIKGQLTVTRGDLLDAIVVGADYAFRYHEAIGTGFSRLFQLMLPADTEDEIKRGAGIVLAYPLFPAELLATGASNEIIISQLIYDLLNGLREDLKREGINHPLTSEVLPVPNRFELEQELKSQGYEIEGDTAVKKNPASGGFKGLLASVFGAFSSDELTVPREGTIEDFLTLARQTLYPLQKDLLTSRIAALRNCLKAAPTNNQRFYAPDAPAKTLPQNSISPSANVLPVRMPSRRNEISNGQPPVWMNDFISNHQSIDSKSKITSTLKIKPPIISAEKPESKKEKQKDWQRDFAGTSKQNSNDEQKDEKKDERATVKKLDWMKDFE